METIKDHLKKLPYPFDVMAIKATDKELLIESDVSLSEALAGAFHWEISEMGFEFWDAIQDNAINLGL